MTTTMANKKKSKTKKKFGEKPSKADQKSFQQRRAEVRAKYANNRAVESAKEWEDLM